MIVELDFQKGSCRVERQDGDPVFHRSGWALAESTFLYHVLQEIKKNNLAQQFFGEVNNVNPFLGKIIFNR